MKEQGEAMVVWKYTGVYACQMGLAASIISLVTLMCWLISAHKAVQTAEVAARSTYKGALQQTEVHTVQ